MLPLINLKRALAERFPAAHIEVSQADATNGWSFLHFDLDGFEVGVQWRDADGFGLSSFNEQSDPLEGMFTAPDEWYAHEDAAFHRLVSLIIERKTTVPPRSTIPQLRQTRGFSQEALSEQLRVKQATYSKLERRDDVKVSSLRKVIEAMGGRLHMRAVFNNEVREITFR